MNLSYGDIFKQRGDLYHAAMLDHPRARDAEFAQLFSRTPVTASQRVLDVPAGGGYLARHLSADTDLVYLELTHGFGGGIPLFQPGQPWAWGAFDHCVSLAALHHIEDQPGFIDTLMGKLAPGGSLHLADVSLTSPIGIFLDQFVGRFNATGHSGRYLSADPAAYARFGTVTRCEETSCPWTFANDDAMLSFCAKLFGLIHCPPELLRDALSRYVGIGHAQGRTTLRWSLLYVDIRRASG